VEEIDEFMRAGKPVMLYFSLYPVILDSVDTEEYNRLKAFKEKCRSNGVVWDYATPDDLRRQLERHLLDNIRRLKGDEGKRSVRETDPQENTVTTRSSSSDLDAYLRKLEVDLKAELASGPKGLDDAKRIIASAEPRLLNLMADPEIASDSTFAEAVNSILADLKRVQRHQLYIDGGASFRKFWESLDEIMNRLKKLARLLHIRAYLESSFSGWVIRDGKHVPRDSYWFVVENTKTHETHRALVSEVFLEETPPNQIEETLSQWRLAEEMRRAGEDFVIVSTLGAQERIPRNKL
jgi:hypothetical protein